MAPQGVGNGGRGDDAVLILAGQRREPCIETLASRGNGVLLWFVTPGFDAALERVRSLGAEILEGPHVNGNWREVWLRDPDGYVVVIAGESVDEDEVFSALQAGARTGLGVGTTRMASGAIRSSRARRGPEAAS